MNRAESPTRVKTLVLRVRHVSAEEGDEVVKIDENAMSNLGDYHSDKTLKSEITELYSGLPINRQAVP